MSRATDLDDEGLLAHWAAEIGERLGRGEEVDLAECEAASPEVADELRALTADPPRDGLPSLTRRPPRPNGSATSRSFA